MMGKIGEKLDIEFVISTGDNLYDNGLKSVNDPLFEESFISIYTAPSLQNKWFNVLGNHDYRGNVEAQLSPILQQIDSRWVCLRSYILDAEIVDLFFVDTTPFVDKYFTELGEYTYDWSGISPRKSYIAKHLEEVQIALKESNAKWKIIVGHHPMTTAGHHRDTKEIVEQLLPILEDINEEWISDKTRFCYDGLKRQRLNDPMIRGPDGCFKSVSWHDALAVVAEAAHQVLPEDIVGIAGKLSDAESMMALKDLLNKMGSNNVWCEGNGMKPQADLVQDIF
ncbi:hypothetical protein MKX01_016632 [Papaver californicum]|nr:hypothetical protein MKX01_016632 [Papaver californicum]